MKALKLQKSRNDRKMMKNAEISMEFIFCLVQLHASVAQLVEYQTSDQKIVSSNPTGSSYLSFLFCHGFTNKPDQSALCVKSWVILMIK